MTDYNTLSDFEINKRVAEILKNKKALKYAHYADDRSAGFKYSDNHYEWFDYCNNPADAWPVIVENKINIMHGWVGNGWGAADSVSIAGESIEVRHPNPLRAAMIVFLMMQDGQ